MMGRGRVGKTNAVHNITDGDVLLERRDTSGGMEKATRLQGT